MRVTKLSSKANKGSAMMTTVAPRQTMMCAIMGSGLWIGGDVGMIALGVRQLDVYAKLAQTWQIVATAMT